MIVQRRTMGTVFGTPTVIDTRHLMKTVEFRIARTNDLQARLAATPSNVQLAKDWAAFLDSWAKSRARALDIMLKNKLAAPFVPDEYLVAPDAHALVLRAIGQGTGAPTSLSALIARFEAASGQRLNEDDHPMPEDFDPDLEAYKKVDREIKKGEALAEEGREGAKDFATSNMGLMILGAAGLVVAGVVISKVYL